MGEMVEDLVAAQLLSYLVVLTVKMEIEMVAEVVEVEVDLAQLVLVDRMV